jgi:leukotriene-A4 hydrolase
VRSSFSTQQAEKILSQIYWEGWLYKPGYQPVINNFSMNGYITIGNKLTTDIAINIDDLLKGTITPDFATVFKNWHTIAKLEFISQVLRKIDLITDTQYVFLRDTLKLHSSYNMEISSLWYQIALLKRKADVNPYLVVFLSITGKLRFIRPLYKAWAEFDKETAYIFFNHSKIIYRSDVIKIIEDDFKLATVNFLQ